MKTIIDMNNLMHQLPECREYINNQQLQKAMEHTLSFVMNSNIVRGQTIAVFDGARQSEYEKFGKIKIVFAYPSDADNKIKSMIRKHSYKQRRQLLIISNDRDILNFARVHDARVLTVDEMIQKSRSDHSGAETLHEKPESISDEEVKKYLELFNSSGRDKNVP